MEEKAKPQAAKVPPAAPAPSQPVQQSQRLFFTFAGDITKQDGVNTISGIVNQLNATRGSTSEIIFFLSTNGGDLDTAIRIYEFLRAIPYKVTTIGFGQVESAGVPIFLAGSRRLCTAVCRFFIHKGTVTVSSPTLPLETHQESLRVADARNKQLVKIIAKETNQPESSVVKAMEEGRIFDPEDAKNFGLVHEVVEEIEDFFKP